MITDSKDIFEGNYFHKYSAQNYNLRKMDKFSKQMLCNIPTLSWQAKEK
jgi:hypothetical protein